MKKIFNLLIIIIFVLLGFVLHLKNPDVVSFSFPFIDQQAPLGLLMLVALLVGVVLGGLLMSFSLVKSKLVGGKAKRKLVKVEKEVESLRSMPVKESD